MGVGQELTNGLKGVGRIFSYMLKQKKSPQPSHINNDQSLRAKNRFVKNGMANFGWNIPTKISGPPLEIILNIQFPSEETETDLSIWIPTEICGIFGIILGLQLTSSFSKIQNKLEPPKLFFSSGTRRGKFISVNNFSAQQHASSKNRHMLNVRIKAVWDDKAMNMFFKQYTLILGILAFLEVKVLGKVLTI